MPTSLTSPALTIAANRALIAAGPALAKASLFARNYSDEVVSPGTELDVAVFDTDEATEFDETSNDYENAEGTVSTAKVRFDKHVKKTFKFSDLDFTKWNLSNVWEDSGTAAGISVGKAILHKITDAAETGTGSATMTGITKASIAGLIEDAATAEIDPAKCVLIMNPARFAEAVSLLDANIYGSSDPIQTGIIHGLYGFKAAIMDVYLTSEVMVVPDDNLVVASRLIAVQSPSVYQEVGQTRDPLSGLILGVRRHGSPAKGMNFWSTECLFGTGVVDKTKILKVTVSPAA